MQGECHCILLVKNVTQAMKVLKTLYQLRFLHKYFNLELNKQYHVILKSMIEFLQKHRKLQNLFDTKDREHRTPLDLAIVSGNPEVVRTLLSNEALIKNGRLKTNALHFCAR